MDDEVIWLTWAFVVLAAYWEFVWKRRGSSPHFLQETILYKVLYKFYTIYTVI